MVTEPDVVTFVVWSRAKSYGVCGLLTSLSAVICTWTSEKSHKSSVKNKIHDCNTSVICPLSEFENACWGRRCAKRRLELELILTTNDHFKNLRNMSATVSGKAHTKHRITLHTHEGFLCPLHEGNASCHKTWEVSTELELMHPHVTLIARTVQLAQPRPASLCHKCTCKEHLTSNKHASQKRLERQASRSKHNPEKQSPPPEEVICFYPPLKPSPFASGVTIWVWSIAACRPERSLQMHRGREDYHRQLPLCVA